MPIFMKKAKYFFPHLVSNYQILDQSILLKTIKLSNSLMKSEESQFWNDLSQRLPKATYEVKLATQHSPSSLDLVQHANSVNTVALENAYEITTNRSQSSVKQASHGQPKKKKNPKQPTAKISMSNQKSPSSKREPQISKISLP
jgi:hypothetical protein